jgi:hypothetical protein
MDRFEKVGVRAFGQLEIDTQGRIEIGQDLADEWDSVIPLI